jgi:hypothetical protein
MATYVVLVVTVAVLVVAVLVVDYAVVVMVVVWDCGVALDFWLVSL